MTLVTLITHIINTSQKNPRNIYSSLFTLHDIMPGHSISYTAAGAHIILIRVLQKVKHLTTTP